MASVLPLLAHLVTTGVGPFYDGAAHFSAMLTAALLLVPGVLVAWDRELRG